VTLNINGTKHFSLTETVSIMALSIKAISKIDIIVTLSIKTISTFDLILTLSINDTKHY
jgi:hypothetical protein